MLESLDIKNLAIIEDIHIDFGEHFTVLTGETGAGKSIILGALELLLGEKVEASIVRSGAEEAVVTAAVSLEKTHPLLAWLSERAVETDDGCLLIKRIIRNSGRGAMYVQQVPMTKNDLAVIGDALFDIHGQHEHQSLLRTERQRDVLDSYGGLGEQVADHSRLFHQREQLVKQQQALQEQLERHRKEEDYLRFVTQELEQASLREGEDEEIEQELRVLSHYETIKENLELTHASLHSNTAEGAVGALSIALDACRRAAKADASLHELTQRLEELFINAQDIADTIRMRLTSMDFSQTRLDELQERLAQLQRLKKKYGPTVADVLAFHEKVVRQLVDDEQSDSELESLEHRIKELTVQLAVSSDALTQKRKQYAKVLQQSITEQLMHLGMPHVRFLIAVEPSVVSSQGADKVEFLFSANPGEELRSLRTIVSGGELSRVMLAIKTVLAESDDVETLVFDEIDAGIGGTIAIAVGDQMAQLAVSRQVIAITHLASIAVKADRHLVVFKETSGGRTYTRLHQVTGEQRVLEIARMLSGDTSVEAAIVHARTLLDYSAQEKFNATAR